MRALLLVAAALTAALGGCVTKSSYKALEADYSDYRAKAEDRERIHQAAIKDLERALAEERARYEQLSGEQQRLEARLDALNADKAKLVSDKSRLESAEVEMRQALAEMVQRKAAAEARIAEYNALLARFKALIDAGKLRVRIVDGQMVVQLATDVLFASGSADLSKEGKDAIVEVTTILAAIPDRSFQVAGHTDNVPIRTSRYRSNWELAFDRAITVVRTMIDGGMPVARISATSHGEFRPTATNDSDEGKAQNRRIEIILVPNLEELFGFDDD